VVLWRESHDAVRPTATCWLCSTLSSPPSNRSAQIQRVPLFEPPEFSLFPQITSPRSSRKSQAEHFLKHPTPLSSRVFFLFEFLCMSRHFVLIARFLLLLFLSQQQPSPLDQEITRRRRDLSLTPCFLHLFPPILTHCQTGQRALAKFFPSILSVGRPHRKGR